MLSRPFFPTAALLLAAHAPALAASPGEFRAALKTGDIVFQQSTSSQSQALRAATGSKYTHVGIVVIKKGTPVVLEATHPVRYTALDRWIAGGVGGHAIAMRTVDPLTPQAATNVVNAGEAFLGRGYDLAFLWSDDQLYCSELVFKAYQAGAGLKLTHLRTHRDYDLTSELVQTAIKTRYPNGLPVAEPVVAPSDLLASPLLGRVASVP